VCRYNWHSADSLGWPCPMLKYKYIFANKTYGSNFVKQQSETVTVWNYQNVDCSLKNRFTVSFNMIFVTLPFPVTLSWLRNRTYHNSLVVNHKLDYLQFGVLIFLQSFDPQSPTCIQHRSHQVSVEPRTYGSRGSCYRRDRQTGGRTDGHPTVTYTLHRYADSVSIFVISFYSQTLLTARPCSR